MQSLKRTRVLLAKITRMLDLLEQSEDVSLSERDLVLSYFKDAKTFFEQDIVLEDNVPSASMPQPNQQNQAFTQPNIEENLRPIQDEIKENFDILQRNATPIVEKIHEAATNIKATIDEKVQNAIDHFEQAEQQPVVPPKRNTWDDLMQSAERYLENNKDYHSNNTSEETNYEDIALPKISVKQTTNNEERTTTNQIPTEEVIEEKKTDNVVNPSVNTNANVPIKKTQATANVEDTPLQDDVVPYQPATTSSPTRKPLVSLHSDDDDDMPSANGTISNEELFEVNKSENYGSIKPIRDLRSAFSLNERLFNINELFAKSSAEYDNAINNINALETFEQAKTYIANNLVEQYGWNTPQKQKKAQIFIRYVWRRFIA